MKSFLIRKLLFAVVVLFFSIKSQAQNPISWTPDQLMKPSELSNSITTKKDIPLIISIGPGAVIPNSIDAGMSSQPEGLEKLKTQLRQIDKDRKIVIYCGCCPFEHCPNVRPAIDILKQMKFSNYYLLDLPQNIKVDWIDKGYPVKK